MNSLQAGILPRFPAMDAVQQEVTDIFIRTKALLRGHFVLRSGLHSGHFFQCAQVCQDMPAVERLGSLLKQKLGGFGYDTVLAPAMGGLVIGQEVARQSKCRFIFAEKENNVLVLRRGFTFKPGEKVLVVEDVITRGGRVQEWMGRDGETLRYEHETGRRTLTLRLDRTEEVSGFDPSIWRR